MLCRPAANLSMLLVTLSSAGCIVRTAGVKGPASGAPANVATGPGAQDLPAPPGAGAPRPSGAPGNLTVLDWAGFRAAATYTFDDTNGSQIQHYDELRALGVRMTFYLITGKKEFADPVWARALRDGHELANHTRNHRHAATVADLEASDQDILQRFGVPVWTMAAPYGDGSYRAIAATRYLINRGVANGLIAAGDDTDPFNLFCYSPPGGASASAMNAEIDAARAAGKWKTVLVHGFVGGTDGAYQPVSIGEFTASVNHAKALGDVWIDSMVNVGAYWRAQKMFSAITPTTSGNSKTWTWTLPPHFTPGRVLRVKVDGGTLTQPGGRALAWDEHGYYEVALDAGSLTLSP
jgi:peptidoglycan/xylan/chitin deacetylase (PgdA/CDA1 family)